MVGRCQLKSSLYLGFEDNVGFHTWNMSSATWVIYSLEGQLVSPGGIRLEPSMNNVVEYSIVIEILRNVISHDIRYLQVILDSQLVVC
jgi:hypothetical protein